MRYLTGLIVAIVSGVILAVLGIGSIYQSISLGLVFGIVTLLVFRQPVIKRWVIRIADDTRKVQTDAAQSLEDIRRTNAERIAAAQEQTGGYSSFAERVGMPRELRAKEAESSVAQIHDLVLRYVSETAGLNQEIQQIQDDTPLHEVLTARECSLMQEHVDMADGFAPFMTDFSREYAKELWEGAIAVSRLHWGADMIDAALAKKRTAAS